MLQISPKIKKNQKKVQKFFCTFHVIHSLSAAPASAGTVFFLLFVTFTTIAATEAISATKETIVVSEPAPKMDPTPFLASVSVNVALLRSSKPESPKSQSTKDGWFPPVFK